ncbi:MAG: hypothetical protein AAF471_08750, partial [Myxococcota bacterium]
GEDAVAERCGGNEDAGGCAALRGDGVEVMATSRSLAHEIVHAVRMHDRRWGPALFEEGLAQALAFGGARGGGFSLDAMQAEPGPVALFDHEFDEPGPYITAGHFVAFVLETRGDALHRVMVGDAFSEPSEVDGEVIDTALRAELGPDLSQLEDEWRGTSRASYSFLGECADTQPIETPGDTAVFGGVHDCESSEETAGPIGAEQRFTALRRDRTGPLSHRGGCCARRCLPQPRGLQDLPPGAPQGLWRCSPGTTPSFP